MKKILAAVGLATALFCGSAAQAAFKPWNPPVRYDHVYSGKTIFLYGKRNYPWRCWNAYACTYAGWPTVGRCTMYMPYRDEIIGGIKFDLPSWKTLLRHERGHCNGWLGSHPA